MTTRKGSPMIGVIVWSSEAREKAVIWCEDQASLAYLQGRNSLTDPMRWPEPGDLVELECETIGALRHARQVALLSEQSCPELPRLLGQQAESRPETHLKLVVSRDETGEAADCGQHAIARAARISAAG